VLAAEILEIGRQHSAKRRLWKMSEDPLNNRPVPEAASMSARRACQLPSVAEIQIDGLPPTTQWLEYATDAEYDGATIEPG
jgi:hypothetical protein